MTEPRRTAARKALDALLGAGLSGLGIGAVELLAAFGLTPAVPVSLPGLGAMAAAALAGRAAALAGAVAMLGYFVVSLHLPRYAATYGNPAAYAWVVGFVVAVLGAGLLRERAGRAAAAERRAIAAEAELATRRAWEEKLRESEARFRGLVELSTDWYWEQDAELRLVDVAGAAMHANVPRTLGQRRWEHANVVDRDDPAWERHKAQLERREPFSGFEYRVRNPEGDIRWISVSGRPMFDAQGAFTGYRGTATDVTERKRTESLVREQLAFMSALLEAIPQPVYVKSLEGRYLSVNRAFEAAYGVRAADVVGRSVADIRPLGEAVAHQRSDAALLAAPGQPYEYEVEVTYADGSVRQTLQHKAAYRQADGAIAGIIGLVTDITPRTAAERALRESEMRFRDVVDASGGFVWETSPEETYTYVSERVREVLGREPADLLGRRPSDFMPPGEIERLRAWVEVQGGWTRAFGGLEHRSLRGDGRALWLRVSGVPVRDDAGRVRGYRGTATDVTEARESRERIQRMNEELEARVQARTADLRETVQELEAFNYTISHDLRAPLRAVNAYAHMAIADYGAQLPEEGRRLLRTAADSALRMAVMLDALLDFSRLARRALDRVTVDMAALAREAADELAQSGAPMPELRIGPLPPCAGDPTLLKQVWTNLIGNAAKYSRGNASPRVEVGWDAAGAAYEVRDNGVGFDMAYADKLFGVFQRLHTDAQFEGTGVGLAIAQRIVQRHGGRIWAESRPGEGACFRFTLGSAL